MKKKKFLLLGGLTCLLLCLLSSWYSVRFNEARLVGPMDFSTYVFRPQDLPMLLSIGITCIYIFVLFISLFLTKRRLQVNKTRPVSPKLGYLGFLGFMGFLGFWSYYTKRSISPFVFFLFFGFFGFYYEGKMSGTYMDERFQQNAIRAQLISCKTVVSILFVSLLVLSIWNPFSSLDYTLIALVIVLSLTLAFGLFLNEYLLYRFDHDDQIEEDEAQ